MSVTAAIVLYVGDKILAQIIKDEVWTKRLLFYLVPALTYRKRLIKIIYETIEEYEKTYTYKKENKKYPFYHSEYFFEHITFFVLFDKGSVIKLKSEFNLHPNVIPPTQDELETFYSLFLKKISEDKILKNKFIDENYKRQIYEITKTINALIEITSSIKDDTSTTKDVVESLAAHTASKTLTPEKTLESLSQQVKRQIKKQINSGKYINDTFIETGEQKDYLRYASDSILFSKKCFEEIIGMDFRLLNKLLKKLGKNEFNLDFHKYCDFEKTITISNSARLLNEWFKHLSIKQQEIKELDISSNDKYKFENKFRDRVDSLKFLISKVIIINETAGQGKTNFLCDFTENFLLTREIPTIFLTGNEIQASDLRTSILKRIFPDSNNFSFADLLSCLKNICYDQNKFFVIVIDGLNENVNSRLLSQNLEILISELLENDFVRIIMSCRTEYYEKNFVNFETSSFAKEMQKITSLISRNPDNELKKKLFETYFYHFNIEYRSISDKAYNQLVSNFLLLRIFCEVYQNEKLDYIDNIYKEELFEKYYIQKSEQINHHLKENDDFKIQGTFDIKNFITSIITRMIERKEYVNIPLDEIINDPKDREMYVRFLDENILVKRDIQDSEKGIFTPSESVNFTFDEFRDFLISRYLIEKLYRDSKDDFIIFIESQINEKSALLEGCSTFLFYISRRTTDKTLNSIISNQKWFDYVFSKCIFSIKDSQVTQEDKNLLKQNIINGTEFGNSLIFNLITRFKEEYYKNLNISFLFSILRELDEKQYQNCFIEKFGEVNWRHSSRIDQTNLLNQLAKLLENKEFTDESDHHKLFELLIYMFINSNRWEVTELYERYIFQNGKIGAAQLTRALTSRNSELVKEINQFVEDYEISL
ncbi:hypothetical protein GCM10028808_39230 [Spirosoma migulaei]